eukprot:TRINITY_DN30934_c0_g1_i1.p1 TRINITY_DN30934_c0_g1~~TRINITY_DN30934_c0_g1_i1.p1  ORF type:complete len:668 (+),score=143.50 TRINITY_DN30934_c0_g1_i1:86-2089(+)
MQTLKDLTNSLQDGNLQKLRDNLQDLPKRWLSRLEQPEDYLLGSVTGDCNYHFTFRLEGGGYFQTGVLVASAESRQGGMPVPLRCRWKRKVADMQVEIPGVTSNMYQISADDVGTDICVEAAPADMDDGHHGVVVGEIGPFELDPATRRSLDNALGLGGSRFTVMQSKLPGEAGSQSRQDLVIQVSTEGVRVTPVQGGGGADKGSRDTRETYAEYSVDFPKIIIHPLDTSKFQLIMSETRSFHLIALSRTSRDLIALTIRCFHAKKYLPTNHILQMLLPVQPATAAPGAPPDPAANRRLDSCIVLERLAKELNRSMQQKEVSEKVLRNTNNEKKQLQEQLMETISGFTEVIEGLQDQFAEGQTTSSSGAPTVERLQDQLRETTQQNRALQEELQNNRNYLDKLVHARKAQEARDQASGQGAGPEAQVHQLKDERDMLKVRLQEVSSSSSSRTNRDQADQVHTKELKGLRQDVESLHGQKEQLRRQLQDQDKERQELQDNFLYVKGQLDKVQMRQAQDMESSGDGSKELDKHRKTLELVSEERSRLASRLESALRDAEKEKAYHEQSVERVMTANGRLMEERDRATKEVERLSRLYADSVSQMQAELNQTNASSSGLYRIHSVGGSPPADPAEIARVRQQLAEVDESTRRKEQENESLKNRIRKLAVA